jgi:hypothetical protein
MRIFRILYERFSEHIDFRSKDTIHGNTVLHIACMNENLEAALLIFKKDPELCM